MVWHSVAAQSEVTVQRMCFNHPYQMKIEVPASGKFDTDAAPGQRACWCRYSEGIQVGTLRMILYLEPEKIQDENSDY